MSALPAPEGGGEGAIVTFNLMALAGPMVAVARQYHADTADVRLAVLTAMKDMAGRKCWTPEMVRAVDRELRA